MLLSSMRPNAAPSPAAFKTMGDDFVSSYVKLAEGEKDPRNLLLAFSIDHVILVEFDIYKHLEVSSVLHTNSSYR